MADRGVEDALARSFLADLPPELLGRLRDEGERADYPAGTTVYRAGSGPQAALVVDGLLRVYLMSVEGRQVTVRYARPGDVLGIAVMVGGPAIMRPGRSARWWPGCCAISGSPGSWPPRRTRS
jgi:CRP/FNR family transcriptional regulator, cyclic AMP receptor protein